MHIVQSGVDFAADEAFGDGVEFHKVENQIDCDRVHPDPDKWPTPITVALDVYHVVEECQRQRTQTGCEEDERGGPDLLDDWKLKMPEEARHYSGARSEERRVGKECRSRWSP